MNYFYGFDIGGTSIKTGLFDEDLKLIKKYSFKTNKENGKTIFSDIAINVLKTNEEEGITINQIIGIGIGIPGTVKDNYVPNCANIKWENIKVEEELKKVLPGNYKVKALNDANAAALGEYSLYSKEFKNIVLLTIGTGVGGGIIINSNLYEGAFGVAGELGHIKIENDYNFECGCGGTNCLETLVSANALVRLTKIYEEKNKKTLFTHDFEAKDVMDKVKDRNLDALKIFDEYIKYFASGLLNIATVLNPEAFIIGGGLSNAGDILITSLVSEFKKNIPYALTSLKNTKIMLAKLANDAGIYGAAFSVKESF